MWTGWPKQRVRDLLEMFYSLNNDKDGLIWEVPLLWTPKSHACYRKSWSQLPEQPKISSSVKLLQCLYIKRYTEISVISPKHRPSFWGHFVSLGGWQILLPFCVLCSQWSLQGSHTFWDYLKMLETVGSLAGLDVGQKIYCWILKSQHLRWLLQPPHPFVLAETLQCPGGIYRV